jgi:hypothetical protein
VAEVSAPNKQGVLNLRGIDLDLIAELKILAYRAHMPLKEFVALKLGEVVRKANDGRSNTEGQRADA